MRILLVDIDTLRPDHLGCYGYFRATSPNIDAVAHEGLRFDHCYCSDAPCLPSRAALVSGVFGIRNGVAGHGGTAADRRLYGAGRGFTCQDDDNNLFNVLRKSGFYTASVSTFAERHSAWWFNAGFNEVYNEGSGGLESGEAVLPYALDWLERRGRTDNWFLHVHFWDPHTPYRAPASFGEPFAAEPFTDWLDEAAFERLLNHTGPHSLRELDMFDAKTLPGYPRMPGEALNYSGLRAIFDGYDTGVLYADSLAGRLFDKMRGLGIYDDAAIIVTSDHGETFGELGIFCEHGTADEATCRVPLIVKWPGAGGGVNADFHYTLDLAPTLAELLDVSPCPNWDGRSWAGALVPGASYAAYDSLVLSQMAHVCQRSARFGAWLYTRTLHDGFHLIDRETLYNLKDDPHEQRDLKEKHPEVCAQGAKIILDWHDELMLKSASAVDPMWTVLHEDGPYHTWGQLDAYLTRLEESGRSAGAAALRAKYRRP